MGAFNMKIAGATAAVSTLFGSTREYFVQYLTDRAPEFSIQVTPADLAFEQHMLDEEADREGLRRRRFTDPFLERAAIQRRFAAFLLDRDILLLHGSTIAADGLAYLFTARCGVGKSTHTRLWQQMLGDRAVMVNDDRAFLQIRQEGAVAFGSPWSGKHGLDSNICVPLAGICLLERGRENRIVPLHPEAAVSTLADQVYLPADSCREKLGKLTEALTQKVPLWHMHCTREPEAAQTAYAAMSGRKITAPACGRKFHPATDG